MPLRSNSTPILKQCIHQSSTEPDMGIRSRMSRPNSVSPSSSPRKIPITSSDNNLKRTLVSTTKRKHTNDLLPVMVGEEQMGLCSRKIPRTSSDSNLKRTLVSTTKMKDKKDLLPVMVGEEQMGLCSKTASSLLGERVSGCAGVGVEHKNEVMVVPGVSVGGGFNGGGRSYGGSGGDWYGDSGEGSESMDSYYQNMIKKFPGDALLLANYAKFLNEIKHDTVKAEEYCERAILAKGSDGDILSMYGDLIWKNRKDETRAQSYFDQAVKSSPDDCYVLASYAQFLWDAEDEDEDEEYGISGTKKSTLQLNLSMANNTPLTAAS